MCTTILGIISSLPRTFMLNKIYLADVQSVKNLCASVAVRGMANTTQPESDSEGSSSSTSSSEEEDIDSEPLKTRLKILNAAVKFVPEYGWNRKALAAGAESLGLPSVAHGMIKGGGAELVLNFNFFCNRKLERILEEKFRESSEPGRNVKGYLHDALRTRLEMLVPLSKRWPEALALMLHPKNFMDDAELLMDLANIIWIYSGDKNVYNKWYSQRLSLAGAYRLSEISLMRDSSPDYEETWQFLQRRVETVVETDKKLNEVGQSCNVLAELSGGAFITMRNLLGMNRFR